MSRPSIYTKELGDKVCAAISQSSRGLVHICKELNISPDSVYKWAREDEEFTKNYARAREAQADFLADEILQIADHNDSDTVFIYNKQGEKVPVEDKEWTNRSRLRVDARKWVASKLRPKKYGDKLDVTTNDEPINKVTVEIITSQAPLADKEADVKLD